MVSMAKKSIRMIDIAKKLGVSVVTVSNALSDKDGVSPELRERIRLAAFELGYQKKETGEEPERPGAESIGVILADHYLIPEHSFYWSLYLNVTEALKERGVYCMLEVVKSDQDIPLFVERNDVSGLIILGGIGKDQLLKLRKTGVPLVLLDFYHGGKGEVSVIVDSFLGGYTLTRYLVEQGHTAIGFVGSIESHMHTQDLYYGYCKALRAFGLPIREDWRLPDREGRGFRAEYPLPRERPTAFVCSCDQSALHFVNYLTSRQIRIPQEISVTGFYDHVFATMVAPQLTTYHIDLKEMARAAVDAVFKLIGGEPAADHTVVSGSIVERDSVQDRRGEPK